MAASPIKIVNVSYGLAGAVRGSLRDPRQGLVEDWDQLFGEVVVVDAAGSLARTVSGREEVAPAAAVVVFSAEGLRRRIGKR